MGEKGPGTVEAAAAGADSSGARRPLGLPSGKVASLGQTCSWRGEVAVICHREDGGGGGGRGPGAWGWRRRAGVARGRAWLRLGASGLPFPCLRLSLSSVPPLPAWKTAEGSAYLIGVFGGALRCR